MMTKRITTSPEVAYIDPNRRPVDHRHTGAVAFAIFGTVVALAPRSTHAVIFNAIKAVADPQSATPSAQNFLRTLGPHAVYRDYGLNFFPAPPRSEDVAAFAGVENELHARRTATLAGRAWTGIYVEGRQVSIISWWVKRSQVRPSIIALIAHALGLSGDCLLEFQDSEAPEAHHIKPKPCSTGAK